MHTSDRVLDGFFHLEIRQVLTVDDVDVMVSTSCLMKLDRIPVPLEFTAKNIQN